MLDIQYPAIGMHIDGHWVYDRPAYAEVVNPSSEAVLGQVPQASAEDISQALASAERGFQVWKDTTPQKRASIILRAAQMVRERSESIAQILTLEQGKPIADARNEIARAVGFLEWDAAQAQRLYGSIVPAGRQMQQMILKQPIGPVAAFTPWNVPIGSPARKMSGALAAGCSVVIKAAEETPGTACAFVQCFLDAGLPAGVVNLLFGNPSLISSALIASPIIRMVTFTGSVAVGKHLTQLAAAVMKPVLMELGGHAPVLIGSDVDASSVGRLAASAKMRLAGQVCASPTRFIIHRKSYDQFVDSFSQYAKALRVGDGFESGVQMGPLISQKRLDAIDELVKDAVAHGARLTAGGHRIGTHGFFYEPTVLADVPPDAKAMTSEPFGPLALCVKMDDLDEGIALANQISVGLSGYAFTNSLDEAERFSRELECGVLSINHFGMSGPDTPFGGVKESGIGREGGAQSLDPYTITKTVLQRTARV